MADAKTRGKRPLCWSADLVLRGWNYLDEQTADLLKTWIDTQEIASDVGTEFKDALHGFGRDGSSSLPDAYRASAHRLRLMTPWLLALLESVLAVEAAALSLPPRMAWTETLDAIAGAEGATGGVWPSKKGRPPFPGLPPDRVAYHYLLDAYPGKSYYINAFLEGTRSIGPTGEVDVDKGLSVKLAALAELGTQTHLVPFPQDGDREPGEDPLLSWIRDGRAARRLRQLFGWQRDRLSFRVRIRKNAASRESTVGPLVLDLWQHQACRAPVPASHRDVPVAEHLVIEVQEEQLVSLKRKTGRPRKASSPAAAAVTGDGASPAGEHQPDFQTDAEPHLLTGADLRRFREERGHSQTEAARLLGVAQGTISKAEREPDRPLAPRLQAYLRRCSPPE